MRRLIGILASALMATTSATAWAQGGPGGTEPRSAAAKRKVPAKTLACRTAARDQGLKGQARKDSIKSCVAAARTACREQTKGAKGADRREEMRACMDTGA